MKRILFCLCLITLINSCNSNDDSQDVELPEANFYALTVGNSWVYKNYRYNLQTEFYDDTGVIDSLSIVDTETINGNTYFKFRRWTTGNEDNIAFCNPNGEHFELLRDSLGFLIRDDGSIKFTNSNYDERVLSVQDWGTIIETLVQGANMINVEAGIFNCINSERFARMPNGIQADGLDHFYYSDGVGLIFDTSSFVSDPIHSIERRLDTYNIIE